MIKRHILRFCISMIFCLIVTSVLAQDIITDTQEASTNKEITDAKIKSIKAETDSIKSANRRKQVYQGTYLNLDIFNPVATAWRDGRFETSLTLDVDLWHRLFPTVEIGFMTADMKEEAYKYETIGCFAKLGANYNFINFKYSRRYDHTFYAGARYGYSYTKYSLTDAIIENKYWNETGKYANLNQDSHFGWFEVVVGVRVQIYKDFFMGVAMQVKTFGHFYEDSPCYPTYIAGYGKYGEDVNFGLNYSLSYRF